MEKKPLVILIVLLIIVGIGIISYLNITKISSPEDKLIITNYGGQAMLTEECKDIGYMEKTSDYIVRGEVISSETKWVWRDGVEGENLYTYSDFKITNYLKGEPLEQEIIQIVTMGGCVGEICQNVEDTAMLNPGEKILYLIEENGQFSIHGCGGIANVK